MGTVRQFLKEDIPQVADLKWKALDGRDDPSPPALSAYLLELFFQNPWRDDATPSLVYENMHGRIVGFFGMVPRPMSIRGRPLRAAFGSNLVVEAESRASLAGLQLVRTFVSGKQDLLLSDSANDVSRRIFARLGFRTALLYSIHWSRPLRPCLYATYALSRMKQRGFSATFARAAKPLCAVADAIATRLPFGPLSLAGSQVSTAELSAETLLGSSTEFSGSYLLRPGYDQQSLSWLLDFMRRMKGYGHLRGKVLCNQKQMLLGWYLYYVRPGGVSEVVQIRAWDHSISEVLDHLFHDAWKEGAIALHGRLEPHIAEFLTRKGCFLYRRGDWVMVHSRNSELMQLFQSGEASFSRLDGEWCLRFGG